LRLDENPGLAVNSELRFYFVLWCLWAVVAVAVVPYLLLRPAPYGRHSRKGFGPLVGARLAWLLMESPSPLLMIVFFFLGRRPDGAVAIVFLVFWLCHYLYRAFLFPLLLPATSRPMPLLVLASGALFNIVNAYLNGRWLFSFAEPRAPAWLASPEFVAGTVLFFSGFYVHVLADRELHRLRRASGGERVLPRGPLFLFVSCPNYLGEIIEWTGFALATWSPGGLLFALWTAANLVPRALHHHRWYREKFPDYPPARRAVLPFLL
jgi:protein-S-isoprenylcysteine O-methyltransferase Ste14